MIEPIKFSLNGEAQAVACRSDTTVLEWLRIDACLRGTKEGCAEGDCGACTVLLKRHGDEAFTPTNSCILLMGQLDGANLMTVEGLAASGNDGHIIQQKMAENGSSQCGFCTPGIVSALAGLLEQTSNPNHDEIHDALAGNLCRCTGYRPIVEAAISAAAQSKSNLPHCQVPTPASQSGCEESVVFQPTSLLDLIELLKNNPDAQLLAGGTDISLDVAHARSRWSKIILTHHVEELRAVSITDKEIIFGGAVTWQETLPHLEKYWPSFATLVRRFGSTQIRSMGTMAGNLSTASPIGDGAPSLIALGAELVLIGPEGERRIALVDFFEGYRRNALGDGEVIKSICVPLPQPDQIFRVYKISKRYDQDISTVCGAFYLSMDGAKITETRIAFGGMAAVPMRCTEAENGLINSELKPEVIAQTMKTIGETFTPMSDMRGTKEYRSLTAANLFERFVRDINGETVEVMAL